MDEAESLSNHFLIAMPQLADPHFFHTVTYICEHNSDGALGIVINRPLDIELGDILKQLDLDAATPAIGSTPIYNGGPVQQERGFVIHKPKSKVEWSSSLKISDEITVTSSRDILQAIAEGKGPEKSLIALGYAGWGAGQLDQEMLDNAWLSGPADEAIIFDTQSDARWKAAASLLGIDINTLSSDTGHA
ncbi:hypothetical protein BOW53_01795 [Solemya pervernicosa gill symbiont]|uniref:UPF0301 protein BOW53_01795 n=2 Tax=Gammaproteobacteria incertae sedis TaxID=118884 RepID=A0A1T2L9Z2_9GAMM|nr:YqgE/AlgH family protein [Candidatus Reidiella endopervernicosa]OOZ41927.1 hypothetical protein BOW53_01795 [Solemya pervernicosa gill symbiont]QKQ24893.1 YqgE/AlgH family protein [Candidatus Reidiella endopervernicosa]